MRLFAVVTVLGFLGPIAVQAQVTLPNGSGDLGAQINAAASAMPANGGKILLQTQASGQCYVFSVPIVITKPIIVQGQGPSTCLNFTGSGTAVTFAGGSSSYAPQGSYVDGFGLRDLLLTGSGPSASQTGLLLGGSADTVGFYATQVTISNFGLGLQFGRGVWNFKMDHSVFGMNGQNVHWSSTLHFGGENMEFDGVTFVGATFANSVEFDDGTTEFSNLNNLTMVSCNFDNAQLVLNNGAGGIRLYSDHFENPGGGSGTEPFVRINAYSAGLDVVMDGPDFYNDQNNPYPPSFIEIDNGPTVTITQMRSINLDGSSNVPTNVYINGWASVTFLGNAPLRAAQTQYTVAPGANPLVWVMGGQNTPNQVLTQGPLSFSQTYGSNNQSPIVQVGGDGYNPYVGFDLWTGVGTSYYGMRIQQNGPSELDFCSTGTGPAGSAGTPNCLAGVANGVFTSNVPDGTAPLSVRSHTPPDNLNAWPATFSASGAQIQNAHITSGKMILPGSGTATVNFQGASAFTGAPACSVSYQTTEALTTARPLSFNSGPGVIVLYGEPYIGVYYTCVGN